MAQVDLGRFTPVEAARIAATTGLGPGALLERCVAIAAAGGPDDLREEALVQTGVFVASCAAARHLDARGLRPALIIFFSSGIYAALVAAGSWSFADGLRAVWRAGQLLADAGAARPGGLLAVIGLSNDRLGEVLETYRGAPGAGTLVLSHHTAPRQHILSGDRGAIEQIEPALRAAGALALRRLPYRVGYHSPLVAGAARAFAELLQEIHLAPPRTKIVDPTRAGDLLTDAPGVRRLLARQLVAPVDFAAAAQRLRREGIRTAIEVGPGNTLSRLLRWSDRAMDLRQACAVDQIEGLVAPPALRPAAGDTG